MLRHSNGIHEKEAVLAQSVGSNITQLLIANGPHTATLHLGIEWGRSHIAHKHHHLQRFHIRAGCHKGTSHGNTEVLVGSLATLLYYVMIFLGGRSRD